MKNWDFQHYLLAIAAVIAATGPGVVANLPSGSPQIIGSVIGGLVSVSLVILAMYKKTPADALLAAKKKASESPVEVS